MTMPMLEVDGLEVRHGAVHAVRGLSLTVDRGEIVGLIGPNGAGKSSRGLGPRLGDVVFDALQEIRERGLAILLVEQRAQRTVALADRSHVLSNGRLRLTLGPEAAGDSETLVSAYFS